MKINLVLFFLFFSLVGFSQAFIFSSKSYIKFSSEDFSGGFSHVQGRMIYNESQLSQGVFDLVIDINSLNFEISAMEKHALSSDFFDANQFPTITFKGDGFFKTDSCFYTTGFMKSKGIEKEMKIPFTVTRASKNAIIVKAEFVVDRNDYGIGLSGEVSNLINVKATLVGIKAK